ncbi:radical SAM protein [Amycolatopsis sp. OK19-0408]|uniref:Ribosomal protein uS12 methylthiotransferase RimO n=1 Tax=Amycolatopsis iheyensis TaxID=2945988 RepID=A0A9X2N701_9PSEU|nr:radical SAM protein [Amycolatopsis iheyensis]MCR6482008.1 radical SAM protein [Amycolatopsis iheyensis]
MTAVRKVSLVTLGCARNEVDSDELAARLDEAGWELAGPGAEADVVVVNTCGFIEAAKKESIDTVLAASATGAKVVAVGCMAERYGRELADALPEAAAVLSFDDYPEIGERLGEVVNGQSHAAHTPRDRRTLLPISPVKRPAAATAHVPGHASPGAASGVRPAQAAGPALPGGSAVGAEVRGEPSGLRPAQAAGPALPGGSALGAEVRSEPSVPRPAQAVGPALPGGSAVGAEVRGEPSVRRPAQAAGLALPSEPAVGVEVRSEPSVPQPASTVPEHGPASGPRVLRHRLGGGPVAPLKLASGCDRRCTFCAIPSFRGAFVSRPAAEILAEAEWLAGHGVRELVLVSENSTSYGKDLGDLQALEKLLPKLAGVVDRVRVSYLQPAELRPTLVETIAGTPGVVPYFDLSFQHASGPVLRRMRRFGDRTRFLQLLERVRALAPDAGVRSNFIAGFPGETDADFAELKAFLTEARLDVAGVFGYSDEDGTEAAGLPDKVPEPVRAQRVEELSVLAEELASRRAEERVGSVIEVLVGTGERGWAAHQAPELDGHVTFPGARPEPGSLVRAEVTAANGIDLEARPLP